jgi:hypothetical protein
VVRVCRRVEERDFLGGEGGERYYMGDYGE